MRLDLILVGLALVGFISSLLALRDYYSSSPICRADERWNCKTVYSIPEAEFMGIHLSLLAPVYFSFLLALTIVYACTGLHAALAGCLALSLAGLALVPYLIYLEAAVAHAFCIHCTVMHVVIASISALDLYLYLG